MTTQTDEWLTIRQAAERLGLSDLSVRRRIKDGRLVFRLVEGKYYVNLAAKPPSRNPGPAPAASEPASDYSDDQSVSMGAPPAEQLARVLPALTDLAERAGRSAVLEERLRELETREATLQERVVALATRNGWLESRLEEREQAIKLLEDSRHRPPWWRRMFR